MKNQSFINKENQKLKVEETKITKYLNKSNLKSYIYIIIAGLLATLSFDYFLSPAGLIPSGIPAFGRIFAMLIFPPTTVDNINNGNLMYYVFFIVDNIPLIIFAWIKVNKNFVFKTLFFMVLQIFFHILINGIGPYQGIPKINANEFYFLINLKTINDPSIRYLWIFLFCTISGSISGVCYGLLYMSGSSTGGTDFVDIYLSKKWKKPIGNINIVVNLLLLLIAMAIGYAINDGRQNSAFWQYYFSPVLFASIVMLFVSGTVTNLVYPRYLDIVVKVITLKDQEIVQNLKINGFKKEILKTIVWDEHAKQEKVLLTFSISIIHFRKIKEEIIICDHEALITTQKIWKTIRLK